MTTLLDQIVERQNQLLEFNEALQRPVVSVVSRMAEMFESQTASFPRLPTLPFASELPRPTELIEAQFGFTSKLVEANKRFALELASAMQSLAEERTMDTAK